MAVITPMSITKAVLSEMNQAGKDVKWACARMVELWKDAFPLIKYVDDVDFIKRKTEGSVKRRPTEDLGLDFDEIWGEDLVDVSSFLGTGVSKKPDSSHIQTCELNAHITEGLTRAQLEKTGFVNQGGLVLTFLSPMLTANGLKVRKGSHILCRAQKYEVTECAEIVNWPDYKGNLYTVANILL